MPNLASLVGSRVRARWLSRGRAWLVVAGLLGCGTRPPAGLQPVGPDASNDVTCQNTCTPDPGSGPYDCAAAEADVEFLDEVETRARPASMTKVPLLMDFEIGVAKAMYSYTDKTAFIQSFVGSDSRRHTWEPPAVPILPSGRCGSKKAVHVQGGPFLGWGGGIGMSLFQWAGLHPDSPGAAPFCKGTPTSPKFCSPTTDVSLKDRIIDVSAWEGISFWARRGPDSQAGFRVSVGDINTDDDIAYRMYRDNPSRPLLCQRVRECGCLNHMACTAQDPNTVSDTCAGKHRDDKAPLFCGLPAIEEAAGPTNGGSQAQCNTCSVSRCNDPYPAFPDEEIRERRPDDPADIEPIPVGDRQFYGRDCTERTFRSGVSGSYCWNRPGNPDGKPADPPPAEPDQQCGDHWNRTVALTNDWQLYLVPFASMFQQGWAKRFNKFDLTAVSAIRFTWDGGWVDYWLDDVRIYRHKSAKTATP